MTARWMLPDGIDEILPPRAAALEQLRRRILDLYHRWGYELCIPPFIEHLDALLSGAGSDLEQQIFKLTDPASGRLLGLRADMTPQAARIDAHRLRHDHPTRLCYIGSTLQAAPEGLGAIRNPVQVGAELFGHAGIESDLEVISLLIETLQLAGLSNIHIDLGQVNLYRALVAHAQLNDADQAALFELLQRKARAEIRSWLTARNISDDMQTVFGAMADWHGDASILDRAAEHLPVVPAVQQAMHDLSQLNQKLTDRYSDITINVDLAELRGYSYHTGVVFAAFVPELAATGGKELARGGRYDHVGEAFGRARPATGFSLDLRSLVRLGDVEMNARPGILAPANAAHHIIAQLRADGERVIMQLPGTDVTPEQVNCDRVLTLVNETEDLWNVEPLS